MAITETPPASSRVQSNRMPGCTSATRTVPTGPSPDVATAITTASAAPTITANIDLAIDSAVRCDLVIPSAARVGLCRASI